MTLEEYINDGYPNIEQVSIDIFNSSLQDALAYAEKMIKTHEKKESTKQQLLLDKQYYEDLKTLTLWDVVKFHTDTAAKIINGSITVLTDSKYLNIVKHIFKNKLNCPTDKLFDAKSEFLRVYKLLLSGDYALKSSKTTYELDKELDLGGFTSNTDHSKSHLSATMFKEGVIDVEEKDSYKNINNSSVKLITKTLIHECVHREVMMAKDFNFIAKGFDGLGGVQNTYTEVYEDYKLFNAMDIGDHLVNADSYAAIAFSLYDALNRIVNAKVDGEVASAIEVKKISSGDTLWFLADRFYGKGIYWKYIWEDNKKNIRSGDPNLIYPDELITINLLREFK